MPAPDPAEWNAEDPTVVFPAVRRRRKRWYRRWLVRVPLAVLAVLVGITALGAAVGPPHPAKATTVKNPAAVCLSLADAG